MEYMKAVMKHKDDEEISALGKEMRVRDVMRCCVLCASCRGLRAHDAVCLA